MSSRKKIDTWKGDPRANNHSKLLETHLGRKIDVKNTKTEKATHGQLSVSEVTNRRATMYRQANEPFATSLVTGARANTILDPTMIAPAIYRAVRLYADKVAKVYGNKWKLSTIARKAIVDSATELCNLLDTLRCGKVANEMFFRTDCVTSVIEGAKKDFDFNRKNMLIGGRSAKAIYLDCIKHLFGWTSMQNFSEFPNEIGAIVDKHRAKIAQDLDSGSASDCVRTSIGIAIDLLPLLDPPSAPDDDEPETETGEGGDGEPETETGEGEPPEETPEETPKETPEETSADESEKDETESDETESGEDDTDINITHVDVGDATELDFDDEINQLLEEAEENTQVIKEAREEKANRSSDTPEQIHIDSVDDPELYADGKHDCLVQTFTGDPIPVDANTINLLTDIQRSGSTYRHRQGQPTSDIWQVNTLGNTKVFGKSDRRSGELVIMIDVSGSMGYPDEDRKGHMAYQVAGAIQEVFPNAQTFAFNSTYDQCYIYPLQNGQMLGERARGEGFRMSGNSDCSALLYMEQLINQNYQGSMAVIISDGSPASPSPLSDSHLHAHTKNVAHRLHDQGLRFVSVLLGGYNDDYYYPSDCKVMLNHTNEIHKVGEAIHRIGQNF